ncbi:MAG: carotenoid biosynthesis protein [Bacteroidales bacterium]
MGEGKRILKSTEILLWVYGVGLAGMLIPFTRELFKIITPLNLIFAAVFLFYGKMPSLRVIITGMIIAVTSFFIEAAGVNTGRIFGEYTYGKALGPALLNTPVIIGLNWFLLIYCTNVISRQIWDLIHQKVSGGMAQGVRSFFIITTGSLLMVLYDLLLEPAATRLDMWSWEGGIIPLRNYLGWLVFSSLFHILVRLCGAEEINRKALPLFAVQVIFFAVIDLFYTVVA